MADTPQLNFRLEPEDRALLDLLVADARVAAPPELSRSVSRSTVLRRLILDAADALAARQALATVDDRGGIRDTVRSVDDTGPQAICDCGALDTGTGG